MPNKKGIVLTKVCPSCGMSFESLQSRNKKYCSEKCRQEHKDLYTTYYCDVCNKEMIILKSRLKKLLCGKQKTLTCSIECAKKFKQTGSDVVCDNCGKIFHRRQQHINRHEHQFCSTKCQFEYQHKEKFEVRKCEICDTKFEVSKLSKQRFCSVECQGKWQSTQTGILNVTVKPPHIPIPKITIPPKKPESPAEHPPAEAKIIQTYYSKGKPVHRRSAA